MIKQCLTLCITVIISVSSHLAVQADTATAKRGMVATVHPIATRAGLQAFADGGNAVDAAIAAAVTLGVVDGYNSGLGGGCFVLIRTAAGEFVAIDGRETAPARATRNMFLRGGKVDTSLSQFGPLAVGIPGALAAYEKAIERCGKLQLSTLLNRAAKVAEKGFDVDRSYARKLKSSVNGLRKFSGSRKMLIKPDGSTYSEGEKLRLPDLARSYRMIANHGSDWFYRGELASKISTWMRDNGGLLRVIDFADYEAKERQPVNSTYRGYEVIGFPPPSSGGIHVAQILNILEHFDLQRLLQDDPARAYHIIAEAMKLAFADRAHWLGDADFAAVPRGLMSKEYAKTLADQINSNWTIVVEKHGLPKDWKTNVYGKHTTHIAAADNLGNWVAITATVNTSFGSKVVVPGTGIILNNQMDDFSAQPGVPNVFGLVGTDANAVAAGKRPLSSMSPTIVLKDGEPVLTVGAAGGPKIISQVVLTIVHYIDGRVSLEQCLARPRLHHQWRPDRIFAESDFDRALTDQLKKYGHQFEYLTTGGVTQGIERSDAGLFVGVSDPRVSGRAGGF